MAPPKEKSTSPPPSPTPTPPSPQQPVSDLTTTTTTTTTPTPPPPSSPSSKTSNPAEAGASGGTSSLGSGQEEVLMLGGMKAPKLSWSGVGVGVGVGSHSKRELRKLSKGEMSNIKHGLEKRIKKVERREGKEELRKASKSLPPEFDLPSEFDADEDFLTEASPDAERESKMIEDGEANAKRNEEANRGLFEGLPTNYRGDYIRSESGRSEDSDDSEFESSDQGFASDE